MLLSRKELMIIEEIHPNLGMKGGAKILFESIKNIPEDEILINFEGSEFMSRSFAQEYVKQKFLLNKEIKEIKVPENIRFMLNIVEESPNPNVKKVLEHLCQ
jgi:hypothetical protein